MPDSFDAGLTNAGKTQPEVKIKEVNLIEYQGINWMHREAMLQTLETIHKFKRSIDLQYIFNDERGNKQSMRHLLIKGRAGVRKIILC